MATKKFQTIDAHHHLWRYSRSEFGWIDDSMETLQKNFLPADLIREMAAADVDGAVAVQARQTLDETRWLLDQAEDCAAIRGVVGWAPIAGEEFPGIMEEFEDRPKLRGLRHVIHDEVDDEYILREDFNSGIRAMRGSGLVYDILIFARHLPQTIEFVDKHPEQVFVLDHVAKPLIRDGVLEPWAAQMQELGRRDNVWCKLSGLVTEADWTSWDDASLKPYFDAAVTAFGPARLLVGSDWPVCLLASEYERWFAVLRRYFAAYSEDERAAIFGGNAVEVYGL
ncbi:amidohydrolase family protein [Granulicella arctica]|uniref:amidohydrolase family protein n=1 Tax=Granulicella arctica TaxID=940613 RepID=UPI0021E002EB|nr:amidohydrolase family protein [Granulicella arctica]